MIAGEDSELSSRKPGATSDAGPHPKRLAAFKAKLVDQICAASGGSCMYTGKDMKSAHMGWA